MEDQNKKYEFKLRPAEKEILSLANHYTNNQKEMKLENKIVFTMAPNIDRKSVV